MFKRIRSLFSRNEHTSSALSFEAARVMRMSDMDIVTLAIKEPRVLRSMAASLLTQAKDRAEA
jgi:hypothetical protein